MVVFRHGDLHASYALPFIEKGIPAWIDKPFTIKIPEALKLIEAADRNNTLVTGGSTLKYCYDIQTLKNIAQNNTSMGKLLGGVMNYPANLTNEYGGVYFYGNHLVEMVMTVFGYGVKSVRASLYNGSITAVAKYDDFQVTLNYVDCWGKYTGVLYFEKGTVARDIDDSLGYRLGFEKLVEMLHTGKRPLPLEHLLAPTVFLNAVEKSIETGNEVFLKELL
jgi:predicted dehydrogenase